MDPQHEVSISVSSSFSRLLLARWRRSKRVGSVRRPGERSSRYWLLGLYAATRHICHGRVGARIPVRIMHAPRCCTQVLHPGAPQVCVPCLCGGYFCSVFVVPFCFCCCRLCAVGSRSCGLTKLLDCARCENIGDVQFPSMMMMMVVLN